MKFRTDFVTNSSSSSYVSVLLKDYKGRQAKIIEDSESILDNTFFDSFRFEDNRLQFVYSLGNGKTCEYPVDTADKLIGLLSFSDYSSRRYDLNPLLFIPYYVFKTGGNDGFPEFYKSVCEALKKASEEDWYPAEKDAFSETLEQIRALCNDPNCVDTSQARAAGENVLSIMRSFFKRVFDYRIDERRSFKSNPYFTYYGKPTWWWLGTSVQYGYGETGDFESNVESIEVFVRGEAHGSETDGVPYRMASPYKPGKKTAVFLADYLNKRYRIKASSDTERSVFIPAGSSLTEKDSYIRQTFLKLGAEPADDDRLVFPNDTVITAEPDNKEAENLLYDALTYCFDHGCDWIDYGIYNAEDILSEGVLPYSPDVRIDSAEWHYILNSVPISDRSKKENYTAFIPDEGQKTIKVGEYYRSSMLEEAEIPEQITEIGEEAFACCKKLKRLTLPDTLKKIGRRAFARSSPEAVKIPASVESIGEEAFAECKKLEKIIINGSMTSLPRGLFAGCKNLKSVTINAPIEFLGRAFFRGLKSLEKVVLPDSLTRIRASAFEGCEKLKCVVFPETPDYVGIDAFKGCDEIQLPDNVRLNVEAEVLRDMFYESFVRIDTTEDMLKYFDDLFTATEILNCETAYGKKTGRISKDEKTKDLRKGPRPLFLREDLCSLKTSEEVRRFFELHFTPAMTEKLIERFTIAYMLDIGTQYKQILNTIPCSSATISRVNRSLQYGSGGYDIAFTKLFEKADHQKNEPKTGR